MSTTTIDLDSLDPLELEREATDTRARAYALLDDADRAAIRADLLPKYVEAQQVAERALGRLLERQDQRDAARDAVKVADHERDERAHRLRAAIGEIVGADVADHVADRLAEQSLEHDTATERDQLADQLQATGAPAETVDAALALLGEKDAAAHAARQAALTAADQACAEAQAAWDQAEAEVNRLADALRDPIGGPFVLCSAWITRMVRPEVYRPVLIAHAEKHPIDSDLWALALLAAGQCWTADAQLTGELAGIEKTKRDAARALAERDHVLRLNGTDMPRGNGWRISGLL